MVTNQAHNSHRIEELGYSSQTTNKINEAIGMMTFEDGILKGASVSGGNCLMQPAGQFHLGDDLIDNQFELSCVSQRSKQADITDFESTSFLSVGGENELFSKNPFIGTVKTMNNIKQVNF